MKRSTQRASSTFAVGTPHGSFRLIVPEDTGADGKPITPEKAAELLLRRGFVRRSINEPRGSEPTIGPGLPYVHVAAPLRPEPEE